LHTASEAIDIPADGEPRELDVAMKYSEDPYCFAYNNENSTHEWSRSPEHRITELEFVAKVTIKGSNFVPITQCFVVSHGGIGKNLSIQAQEQKKPQAHLIAESPLMTNLKSR
jgi:hypothetical protein